MTRGLLMGRSPPPWINEIYGFQVGWLQRLLSPSGKKKMLAPPPSILLDKFLFMSVQVSLQFIEWNVQSPTVPFKLRSDVFYSLKMQCLGKHLFKKIRTSSSSILDKCFKGTTNLVNNMCQQFYKWRI